jgi:molybdopterin/thiamine biosynthesis adenylyltransferase
MGIDAVNRQAKASVAVFGLGPFAIEVVKNIVLSGCRLITLIDDSPVTWNDLSGQFFLTETDIGKNRVESCLYKIQELNLYVKVDQMSLDLTDLSKLKDYTVIFVTELPYTDQIKLNNFCRDNKIKFISADCNGPYARLFNDFGSEFEVLDKNGELRWRCSHDQQSGRHEFHEGRLHASINQWHHSQNQSHKLPVVRDW